uniref:Uncharacterized protein n=1 Tax=Oncorhynchus mykiss TaxID=8022 RepID=A0A8K9X802_ONCMY
MGKCHNSSCSSSQLYALKPPSVRIPAFPPSRASRLGVLTFWLVVTSVLGRRRWNRGCLDSSSGFHTIAGSSGFHTLASSSGFHTLAGSSGFHTLAGSSCFHTLAGSSGFHTLAGSSGFHTLAGSSGFHTLAGSLGFHTLASSGNHVVSGSVVVSGGVIVNNILTAIGLWRSGKSVSCASCKVWWRRNNGLGLDWARPLSTSEGKS